jgi:cytochrome c-type protein NapC
MKNHRPAALFAVSALCLATAAVAAEPDWSTVPAKRINVFYPGVASLEWTLNGKQHSAARDMADKGRACTTCHDKETRVIARKIVSGELLEPHAPKGKADHLPVAVQAAHDGENIYLRFQWQPGPGEADRKDDAKNQAKLAVMIEANKLAHAAQTGCWATCHTDLRSMPDVNLEAKNHPRAKELDFRSNGPTKYVLESRTAIEIEGKPQGGWDRLRSPEEIAAMLQDGRFYEMWQYRSGAKPRSGYVGGARIMQEAPGLAAGKLENGTWTVTFTRKLAAAGPGVHALEGGKLYNFGFAVHDEYANERQHHVSLGYTLGIDNPQAVINAARR